MNNQDIIDKIALELNLREKSDNKIRKYLLHIDCFLSFLGHDIDTIEEEDIEDYMTYLRNIQKSRNYIKTAFDSIRFLFHSYGKNIKTTKLKKERQISSDEEIDIIISNICELKPRLLVMEIII
ncbi:MAG: phage integrase N-terminal SAM-like domain-containing protein [Candidatus Pacearchaeota archaeon]|jgi:site-specific recombinase XerD